MKRFILSAAAILLFPAVLDAASPAIKQYPLDDYVVQTINVPYNKGTTTFLFPSAVTAIRARKVVTQAGQKGGDFVLNYKPGTHFFSLAALRSDAEDYLTVIYNRKAYVFLLKASDKPDLTVTLYQPEAGKRKAGTSPAKLAALLDKAKSYHVLNQYHPDAVAGVGYARPAQIMRYIGFRVLVEEVWRFEEDDTLVFRVTLDNETGEPIYYKPQELSVRVGDRIYNQSIADASGVMPPHSPTTAFFAITGNPAGGRNNLSVENSWNILVPRITEEDQAENVAEMEEEAPLPSSETSDPKAIQ